jgi:hypothetical protein
VVLDCSGCGGRREGVGGIAGRFYGIGAAGRGRFGSEHRTNIDLRLADVFGAAGRGRA